MLSILHLSELQVVNCYSLLLLFKREWKENKYLFRFGLNERLSSIQGELQENLKPSKMK